VNVTAMTASVPREAMLAARRGTAYFSRILNALSDEELAAPATGRRHDGRTRAALVAGVALHARAMAEVFEATRIGQPYGPHATAFDRDSVRFAATLAPSALRNLHAHTVVHLNVEWRDLPESAWQSEVAVWNARRATPTVLVGDRRRLVWSAALALDPLGRVSPLPADLRDFVALDIP
jgi:maleylpyruvate isomerase